MPVSSSAMKRVRQTVTRTAQNREVKSRLKTAIRQFTEANNGNDKEAAYTSLNTALRLVDKAVAKGVIHKNNGARKKSLLTRLYNKQNAV